MADRDNLRLGTYVITSSGLWPGRTHWDVAVAAVKGGADAVQLRCPDLDDEALLALARALQPICAQAGVLLLVNNRLEVAVAGGASGVHLGQDAPLSDARRRLGSDRLLGISVATPEEAIAAERFSADYVGVTVWATATKPEAAPAGLDGLRAIVAATRVPVVAIGGITTTRVPDALGAGAAGVAVISAVGAAPDPAAATRELSAAVRRYRQRSSRMIQ